jgi:Pyruvate/2-oxoacid:ferredoxin oxidoreductase gamma subunit
MTTPAKERMRKSRAHRRLGLRPVQVLVSEQDIDFLLARHYELIRKDADSIGRAVSAFLSDLVLEAAYAEGAMQKVKEASETPRLIPGR